MRYLLAARLLCCGLAFWLAAALAGCNGAWPELAAPQGPASWPALIVSVPGESASRPAGPAATPLAAGSVGLGAYSADAPYDELAALDRLAEQIDHRLAYALWFQAWGDSDSPFPEQWVSLAAGKGLVPVLTWEPWQRDFAHPAAAQPAFSLSSIAAGAHDEYIRSWAREAKEQDVRLILRFAQEQSTEPGQPAWYPWQGDPAGFKAAYRHIVAIFRQEGASKVQFMWSAMWLDQWAAGYYPGDDVVDLVGTTVLNHGTAPTVDWARWRSFDELFAGQYAAARQWGKPIFVTELASAEQGGDKAAWLRECLASLPAKYPLVRGLLLLEVQSDREWPAINWSVASSPASLAAFRQGVRGSYFR